MIDLVHIIGETTDYDKKQQLEVNKPKSWCKSVSAFANGRGGSLIFGVADDDTVIGLEDPQYVSEKFSEIVKSKLDPVPEFSLSFEKVDGKTLMIVRIEMKEEGFLYGASFVGMPELDQKRIEVYQTIHEKE